MSRASPIVYIIAGCNGAGKTTFAKDFLPREVHCLTFLNADEIARGLSPLAPSAGAIKAGRLLLNEVAAKNCSEGHLRARIYPER
jgi:predicted ABC-type ATPase